MFCDSRREQIEFACRCNCSVSWEATGGDHLSAGCTSRGALLAAAAAGPVQRSRNAAYSYYQVRCFTTRHLDLTMW